jgi:hypothetical protein
MKQLANILAAVVGFFMVVIAYLGWIPDSMALETFVTMGISLITSSLVKVPDLSQPRSKEVDLPHLGLPAPDKKPRNKTSLINAVLSVAPFLLKTIIKKK